MKILWYTNTPCLYKQNNAYNGGGWLSSLQTLLMRRSEIELGIAFPLDDEKEKVVEKGVSYYPLSMPKLAFKEKFKFFICKWRRS